MTPTAVEKWRSQLEQWAFPPDLLEAVELPPPPGPTPRLSIDPDIVLATPTARLASARAGKTGSILDVGAGDGRLAVPLAKSGHRVTVVEPDEEAVAGMRRRAADEGTRITAIVGNWPQVAGNAGEHDVVLAAHTPYWIHEVEGFVAALHDASRRAVVIEMAPVHPWAALSGYFESVHGVSRPDGPTADEFGRVVAHVLGLVPAREYWTAEDRVGFESLGELLAHYRRLLLVPPEHAIEAAGLLERDVRSSGAGGVVLGPPGREAITLWWETV